MSAHDQLGDPVEPAEVQAVDRAQPKLEALEPRLLLSISEATVELLDVSPAVFVENVGQWEDAAVRFASQHAGMSMAVMEDRIVFHVALTPEGESSPDPSADPFNIDPPTDVEVVTFRTRFVDANAVVPVGLDQQNAAYNFYVGDQGNWRTGVSGYAAVAYAGLWDGIDVLVSANGTGLKYEFMVAPGADVGQIAIAYEGTEPLTIDTEGDLVISTSAGVLEDAAPEMWQEIGAQQVPVDGGYRLINEQTYGLSVTGSCDPQIPLRIDPQIAWSSYFGGSAWDTPYGIAVDASGNVVVGGYTGSVDLPFPDGYVSGYVGSSDVFVSKITASGEDVLWTTYLGGSAYDVMSDGLALDGDGDILVAGGTRSSDFPTTMGLDTTFDGGTDDGFAAKFASDSGELVWSTFLGGSGRDSACGAVIGEGGIYVAGQTSSTDFPLRTTEYHGGQLDAFLAKLSATGEQEWAVLFGGSGLDGASSIAVDSSSDVFVAGGSYSETFPDLPDPIAPRLGGSDGFVARFSTSGHCEGLTFVGGSGTEDGVHLAVGPQDDAFVTGRTSDSSWALPASDGNGQHCGGGYDAFLAKLDAGLDRAWTIFVGGSAYDQGFDVAVDSVGDSLLVGYTESTDFYSPGAFDATHNGSQDAFVARLTSAGGLRWSSYLGGSALDIAHVCATGAGGLAFVAGGTASGDFPLKEPFDAIHAGPYDGFVVRVDDNRPAEASDDGYAVDEDETLTVGTPGVLGNDTDPDGDPLTAALVEDVRHGTLTLDADGSFVYEPSPNFNGTDSFTYKAYDNAGRPYVPDADTWALYHFDGDLQDSSGNDRDLTLQDPEGRIQFTDSWPGRGLGSCLFIPEMSADALIYSTDLRYPGSGSWTAEALVFVPTEKTGYVAVVTHETVGLAQNDPYQLGHDANTDEAWWRTDEGFDRTQVRGHASQGSWHHIAGVYDEWTDSLKLYVDGELTGETPGGKPMDLQSSYVYVGSDSYGIKGPFYIDELRISNLAREPGNFAKLLGESSNVATATITVAPVNDTPVARDDSYTVDEDGVLVVTMPGGRISAGINHTVAVQPDGTIAAWGVNSEGQCNVPAGLADVVAVNAGIYHNLALKSDGSVVAWGSNNEGQCDVPVGLSDVVGIAAGCFHSVALKSDGTVVVWGANDYGQRDVPEDAQSNVVAISSIGHATLALTADGMAVAWGDNAQGQTDVPPEAKSDVVAISINGVHSLALKSDGSVISWGAADYPALGAESVPVEAKTAVVAISAGMRHSLALKSDGTVVAWGYNEYGQLDMPAGLSNVVAISAGGNHSLALKSDSTPVMWGRNQHGQLDIPEGTAFPRPGVLVNDTDADGDLLTAQLASDVSHGTLDLHGDGSFTYTPEADFNGTDSFTYVANDGTPACTGELTYAASYFDGQQDGQGNTIDGIAGTNAVAASADGAHVYVAGQADNAIAVFARDPLTGELTFVEKLSQGGTDAQGNPISGLISVTNLTVSPDGANVYVAAQGASAVVTFARDALTGRLTFVQALVHPAVDGLYGAHHAAVSPDGAHVYVAAHISNQVGVFDRDPATGALTLVEVLQKGQPDSYNRTVDGLGQAANIALTSDGSFVYVAGLSGEATVFQRDPNTGRLRYVEFLQDGGTDSQGNPLDGLAYSMSVAVSPDDAFVYFGGYTDNAVTVFSREPLTGVLTLVERLKTGVLDSQGTTVEGISGTCGILPTEDGQFVYVTGCDDDSVATFRRDPQTGQLLFAGTVQDGQLDGRGNTVDGLDGAKYPALSADGAHLYVAGGFEDAVAVFRRAPGATSQPATVTISVAPVNDPPTITVDQHAVTVDEGQTAHNTGAFADIDSGDIVTITASVGTVTQDGAQSGTWNWSYAPADGPDDSQPVTITGKDQHGVSGHVTFALIVENMAPAFLWQGANPLLTPRSGPAVTVGSDGLIYAIGGVDQGYGAHHTTGTYEYFNEQTQEWTLVGEADGLKQHRAYAGAVTDSQGRIWVVGGLQRNRDDGMLTTLRSVEMFDPGTKEWTLLPESQWLNTPRNQFGIGINDNWIYVYGGYDDLDPLNRTETMEVLDLADPGTGWQPSDSMPVGRGGFGVAVDSQGRMYAIGGGTGMVDETDRIDVYDPQTGQWRSSADGYIEPYPIAAGGQAAFYNARSDEIWVVGGWQPGFTSRCYIYSFGDEKWHRGPEMYEALGTCPGTAVTQDGVAYVIGGERAAGQPSPNVARWGLATFEIEENSANGTFVGSVTGTDPGDDTLTYDIVGGNELGGFAIAPNTGAITVADATQMDYETTPTFMLEVTVTDSDDESGLSQMVRIDLLNQASVTGVVFVDVNENDLFEANEPGIDGVTIELLDAGGSVLETVTTSDGGFYLFEDLDPGTYQVHEVQPTGVDDGAEILGSLGGDIVANDTMQLDLARIDATDYVFAEHGQEVTSGDTATIGFWQNKHGQALIQKGGTGLAQWLTANFGNVFGDEFADGGGDHVASFFKDQLFRQKASKSAGPGEVDAQFMATAFATYFTNGTLAGSIGADYGFNVTDTGLGTKIVNVGSNGAAFDVADGTDLTVMQLLLATNALTDLPDDLSGFAHIYDLDGNGEIDSYEALLRTMANKVYIAINAPGEI